MNSHSYSQSKSLTKVSKISIIKKNKLVSSRNSRGELETTCRVMKAALISFTVSKINSKWACKILKLMKKKMDKIGLSIKESSSLEIKN